MKALSKIFLLLLVPFLLVFVGCKDDDSTPAPAVNDFEVLQAYLEANDLDLTNILDGWITAAPTSENDVPAFLDSYYVMDIRSATDFAAGHIAGAVNTSLASIVADAADADKPILVVCYTGQTAGHAVVALRLSGYDDAKVLKFGMSGWHSDNDSWSAKTGDIAIGNDNWVNTASTATTTFNPPTLNAAASEGAGILAERVALLTSGGLNGVNNTDVLASPSNYMINNFWDAADVSKYGCIDGAFRIKPLTLAGEEIFKLDPSKTIVTYCWTGQTSSMVTAYLKVLGYDAKSLKFGVNGMIYSNLEGHKFGAPSVDLPVVTE